MSEKLGITVKKKKDFSKWFVEVVRKAKLGDYTAMKGFMVFMPDGYAIWEKMVEFLDKRLKETGHKNAYFPFLIPENFIKKEEEHFTGFKPETFVVTHSGDKELSEKLMIRPTSETIAYDSYSKWIRSWRDLPLLLNFWNSVVRAEIKSTKLFVRTTEFLWQEGHTAHATKEEADEEVKLILKIYKELCEELLAIPVLFFDRPSHDRFPGALYSIAIEGLMPDGKALQGGTDHNLGQNFSKAFDIKFVDKDEKEKYVWQTCWAVSSRLIGALVMLHGDDDGLIIPPKIAPIQIIIIPITFDEGKERVLDKCREIKDELKKAGYRVEVDERDEYTPGWKFNEWELKGVPLRIEIGPTEIENRRVVLVRRDDKKRIPMDETRMIKKAKELLEGIQDDLFKKAKKLLDSNIFQYKTMRSLKRRLKTTGGFVKVNWCGKVSCAEEIKSKTNGGEIMGTLFDEEKEKPTSKCIGCGKRAKQLVYVAKAY